METCTVIMFLMVVAGGLDPVSLRADLDPRRPDLSFGSVWEVPARSGLVRHGWCGGINPYTLTARLGPARISGFGPPKDDAQPG